MTAKVFPNADILKVIVLKESDFYPARDSQIFLSLSRYFPLFPQRWKWFSFWAHTGLCDSKAEAACVHGGNKPCTNPTADANLSTSALDFFV